MEYKIVSWNCGGGFRNKFRAFMEAYRDAHVYVIAECEDPYFYDDEEFKRMFGNGFRIGIKTKGLAVIAREDIVIKRLDWLDNSQHSFAPVTVNGEFALVATWTHPDYVEELHEYLDANIARFNDKTLMIGDFNSSVVFDKEHRDRNHSQLIERLGEKGLKPIYHHFTEEEQGKESVPTYYHRRHLDEPFHIDHTFANPEIVDYIALPPLSEHNKWLELSDHMPMEIVIVPTPKAKVETRTVRPLSELKHEQEENAKRKPRLEIRLPNGRLLTSDLWGESFRRMILELGIERIHYLNFEISGKNIITKEHPNNWYKPLADGWYVNTGMTATRMKTIVHNIARALGESINCTWAE